MLSESVVMSWELKEAEKFTDCGSLYILMDRVETDVISLKDE